MRRYEIIRDRLADCYAVLDQDGTEVRSFDRCSDAEAWVLDQPEDES